MNDTQSHRMIIPTLCQRCKDDCKRYSDSKDRREFLRVLCRSVVRKMTGGEEVENWVCPHKVGQPLPKYEKFTFSEGKAGQAFRDHNDMTLVRGKFVVVWNRNGCDLDFMRDDEDTISQFDTEEEAAGAAWECEISCQWTFTTLEIP